jgi:hypothetical protein
MIHGLLSRDFYHLNDRRIKHMLSKFSSWPSYTLSDPMFQAAGIQATPRSSYILFNLSGRILHDKGHQGDGLIPLSMGIVPLLDAD